jgi:hypothetical protein
MRSIRRLGPGAGKSDPWDAHCPSLIQSEANFKPFIYFGQDLDTEVKHVHSYSVMAKINGPFFQPTGGGISFEGTCAHQSIIEIVEKYSHFPT